jgi:hypothetical protein
MYHHTLHSHCFKHIGEGIESTEYKTGVNSLISLLNICIRDASKSKKYWFSHVVKLKAKLRLKLKSTKV